MPDEQTTQPNADAIEQPAAPKTASTALRDELSARQASGDDVETSLWSGGYSPKAMVGTWIVGVMLTLAVLIAAGVYFSGYFLWALVAVLVIWAIAGGMYAYRRLGVYYELTSQRFIHQAGIVSRRTDRIEVIDIDDVSVKQGPVERIFGVGNVVIQSSDTSHPKLEMLGIADVRNVASLIDDIRRKERRRRSLHIEAI